MVPRTTESSSFYQRQMKDRRFFLVMAIVSALVVFVGFGRAYYLQGYFGTPKLSTHLAVHGFIFTVWMLYFIGQTALVASNRAAIHRCLGYAGVFLAVSMVTLGLTVGYFAEVLRHAQGPVRPETVFMLSNGDVLTFSVFIAAGFVWRRSREAHQRLMLMATMAGLLFPAIARMPVIQGHSMELYVTYACLLLTGPAYDLVSRRRVHPAYLWGLLFVLLTSPPVRFILAATPAWYRIARRVAGL
jgi:hypothetical protein